MSDTESEEDPEAADLDVVDIRRADGSPITPDDLRRVTQEAQRQVNAMWPFRRQR